MRYKKPGRKGFRFVNSPDSEVMTKYIENFDYVPERRNEVLKKYERMAMPAHGIKR